MAFSWSNLGTLVEAYDLNEIKNNVDIKADEMGIDRYDWKENPVFISDVVKVSETKEMRDAVDYLDDNNVCSTYYSANYETDNNDHNDVVDNDQDTGYYSDEDAGIDNDKNTGYYSVENSGKYSDVCSGHNDVEDGTIYSDNEDSFFSDEDGSRATGRNRGVNSAKNSSVDGSDKSGYCGDYNTPVCSSLNYSVCSAN